MKRKSFLVSILALAMLIPALLISAPTAASDKDDDDGDDEDRGAATCEELLLAFGEQLHHFNTQRLEALAKSRPDAEETGEVWAEYFEELADLFEDFGEDLADAKCPFPRI